MITQNERIRLHRAREVLAEASLQVRSIHSIAADACFSQSHFIRRFRAVFGETPHQFRTRVRLERAKQLLVLGEESVTTICMALGFSSPGSFSWLFSRHFGESPQAYRRRLYPTIQMPGRMPWFIQPGCLSLMALAWSSAQFSRSDHSSDPLR
ncbi:MAG: helix-turn-helix transcriptional regulator [Pseudomonadota bacterium]